MMTIKFIRSALIAALLGASLTAAVLLPAPTRAADSPVSVAPPARPARPASPASAAPPATPASVAAADSTPDAASSAPDNDSNNDSDNDDSPNWDSARNQWRRWSNRRRFHQDTDDLVSVWHDANLPVGASSDSVVAVFGSATNNGTARQDVVSVFGDTTVNGPAAGSAVAVMGNVSVNADVGQDVVAVLGDVNLGPAAHVHGHVVSILGTVTEDPGAIVDQGVERILPGDFISSAGLRQWVGHGLMIGRPLVIGAGLQWLWGISFAFLAIYTILALLFRDATEHCIASLNEHPGKSLITAILAVLLTPLMFLLLAITVVGLLVIPIAIVTLFCCAVFGKTTVLGWIGNRCFGMRPGVAVPHPALAVIVGGLLVMLAYLVPILGFVVFILLSMLGYGAVLYALINRVRRTTSGGTVAGGPGTPGAAAPAAAAFAEPAPAAHAAEYAPPESPAPESPAAEPQPSQPAPAPLPLTTLPRAGFWIRIGALFIDAVIIWAVIRLLLNFPQEGSDRLGLLSLAAYGAVMWKVKGTTVGGIACDLRVVRLDSRPIDWPTACVRALGCILSLCALGLGFIWIAFDPGKQAWHDKLAGTIVVRAPKGMPLV
jgi:uncharacterized RDD family membrane protein YckC